MKLELPMLSTDHELDMSEFAKSVIPDLINEHLPLESLDEEADEGMSWPSAFTDLLDDVFQRFKAEKVVVLGYLIIHISKRRLYDLRTLLTCKTQHSCFLS